MCRTGSCLVTTAYILLVIALLACTLSYIAPFWILFPDSVTSSLVNWGSKLTNKYRPSVWTDWAKRNYWVAGLWGACRRENENSIQCDWFLQDDFKVEKGLDDFHKAAQGLFGAGLILLFIGSTLTSFHVCCRCCKESFSISSVIGCFTIVGAICVGIGIGVYGGFMAKEYDVSFEKAHVLFYWGFFVGIAGALLALVSAILLFINGCCARSHSGYHMTRVV